VEVSFEVSFYALLGLLRSFKVYLGTVSGLRMHSQVSLHAYESLAGRHGLLREARAKENGPSLSLIHAHTHSLSLSPTGGHIRLHGGRVHCLSLSLSLSLTTHTPAAGYGLLRGVRDLCSFECEDTASECTTSEDSASVWVLLYEQSK
jgi:hypothetical protein